jgi:RNA polymerase sigma-70 factor, ECF subfamily
LPKPRCMTGEDAALAAARAGDEVAFRSLFAPYQRELRAYCYRMAGSLDEADDLVQESLLRAWRGLATFEGRSSVRTWLYRVAFSACIDALESKGRRSLAVLEGPPASPRDAMPPPRYDVWVEPCPGSIDVDGAPSPEARYSQRESVALAFLAALQLLSPKQRAALLACDVLGWTADECAQLLGGTVTSVQSALQRARETLDANASRFRPKLPDEQTKRTLLARYVEAWERADVPALVSILHEDATLAMPPLPLWLHGPKDIGDSIGGMVLTPDAAGVFRLRATEANGSPAFAAYRASEEGGFRAFALHVLSLQGDRISAITAFLDPRLFAKLDLPAAI